MRFKQLRLITLALSIAVISSPALAAKCGNSAGGFNAWKAQFTKEARKKGISQKTLNRAFKGVSYDRRVIRLDRSQKSFKLSFAQFYKRRAAGLVGRARRKLKQNAGLLRRIEKRFGVPGPILVSIWGLETGFGGNSGKMNVVKSLATLSYDCRRTKFFTRNLYAALKIIQRGDMSPGQMRGAWAGELGQTQFMAHSYLRFAVDFDGNGRRDLVRSRADVLASTANYLRGHGWKRGGSWGPGTHNHNVLRKWNKAGVYRKTIAKMANAIK
ncbi:MAG: lytic murein transglycosylase [bacterium]|nr:lytic murein transglycosylase [bacterium]